MIKQFVVTCYIIKDEKFLFLYHPKHQKWLPPGGHVELNESPEEAVRREVMEETGLSINFASQENLWIEEENARSFPRPYLCLLENVPKIGSEEAHIHIDLIYVARPKLESIESEGRWFTRNEIALLKSGEEVFADTKHVVEQIYTDTEMVFQNLQKASVNTSEETL